MEEKDDEVSDIVEEDLTSLPLPPTTEFSRPSFQEQRGKKSYGSLLQEFYLDTETLKNLLSGLDVRKTGQSSDCGLNCLEDGSGVSASPAYIFQRANDLHPVVAGETEGNQDELLRQQKLGHRQKDSGISPDYLECSSPTEWSSLYLAECSRQFENLWRFAETRLDQIADDYKHYQSRHCSTESSHFGIHAINCIRGSIQSKTEEKQSLLKSEDIDAKSIGGDSGIEEDHLTVVRGLLEQLRDVVTGLKQNVEANVRQLTEFVMLHDHAIQSGDGKILLLKQHVHHAVILDRLAGFITDIDAELLLTNGEDRNLHKKEMEYLRVFYQAMKFRPGCVTLLSFLLLLATFLVVCILSCKQTNQSVIFMRLVRSPLLIAMYFFMYGLNLMAWARNGINYVSIFSYPANGIPTPKIAFRIGSLLSVCFCSLVAVYFLLCNNYLYIADKIVAVLQWLLLLGMLINPFRMFIRPGRFAFILVWFRIFFSPFSKVTFGDFWFADQLNSMVALFVDVQYFICYSTGTSWLGETANLNQCTTNRYGIRPLISCLPSWWRFMQCLRCYYDTRQIKHLLNAGKYFTTFPVVVFAVVFSMKVKSSISLAHLNLGETGWIIICWFVSSLTHALYCFIWDITQDWGLFCFHKKTILRPTLLYNSKCLYLVAIIFDFIVRFLCAIKLTLIIVYNLDSDLFYTGLVFAEIVRRFVWNFFRVEYEQVMINHKLEVS